MKQITIDYSASPVAISDRILGNQGEALATELEITLPDEMINDSSVAEFCGVFGSCNGVYHSGRIAKSEITDGALIVPITAEISSNLTVSFQVEAFSSDDSLIMKTSLIEGLTFNKSVCRNHSDLSKLIDPADLANITAEIKANTLARHTHSNSDTLDKLGDSNGTLTYNGKPIGGGEREVIEESFTEEYGDFAFTIIDKVAILTVASDSINENTEIKSIKILFASETNYIDINDVALHYNEFGEPCISSMLHPTPDDGSESFVVGFKVASIYFPLNCKALSNIESGGYSAVAVDYYGG